MSTTTWWPRRAQGLYYVATGLWPVVFPRHYMAATDQPSNQLAAQLIGGAVAIVGGALALDVLSPRASRWVGLGSAIALGAGGAYFAARGRGIPVNATDALVQVAFAVAHFTRPV